jgi:predicted alpha/beta hydrolase family esterase
MKKQILIIHGGTAFTRYEDFLEYLKNKSIDEPLADQPKGWKPWLREAFGEVAEVYLPSMPNKQNAKYAEWKLWFERHLEFLRDGAILIGHSQGGIFLAKYFTENNLPISIRALYLIAAPIGPDDFGVEDGGDFVFEKSRSPVFSEKIKDIYIFHSRDDPVVPYAHALQYKEALPAAQIVTFEDKGHFIIEEFPELVAHIKALS